MPKFLNTPQWYNSQGGLVEAAPSTFDLVIKTQAEFEAMIASSDWLGAKSVAFVGDGGTLAFTRSDGQGILIPSTVKQIQGFNSAKIEVTNFVYNSIGNQAALWYGSLPKTNNYFIKDLNVSCTGPSSAAGVVYVFMKCTNLTNCIGTTIFAYTGYGISVGYVFNNCSQLTNCTANGNGGIGSGGSGGYGFTSCTQLTNCTANGNGAAIGYAFYDCTQLINCTGTGSSSGGGSGIGFVSCKQLTNCTGTGDGSSTDSSGTGFSNCTQLTNCAGSGTGNGIGFGYGFYSCSYCNGCKASGSSRTAIWGGTTTKRDDNSCQLNGET